MSVTGHTEPLLSVSPGGRKKYSLGLVSHCVCVCVCVCVVCLCVCVHQYAHLCTCSVPEAKEMMHAAGEGRGNNVCVCMFERLCVTEKKKKKKKKKSREDFSFCESCQPPCLYIYETDYALNFFPSLFHLELFVNYESAVPCHRSPV